MARIYNKDARLESQRWFPIIAWGLVLGFAVFVYLLTTSAANKISTIEAAAVDEDAYLIPVSDLRRQNLSQ